MSRRSNSRSRLERRAAREARRPGAPPRAPRPPRQRPGSERRRRLGGLGFVGSIPILHVLAGIGAVLIVAFVAYAITQRGGPGEGEKRAQRAIDAIMDSDASLPGVYVPPHAGVDGVLCSDLSCFGRPDSDDRRHVADNVDIPICTAAQLAANKLVDPSYGQSGICYQSNPPTSGPHSGTVGAFKIYENPLRKENAMHSMEHGGVIVWYNTSDQAAIDKLKDWVKDELDRGRLVVMTKYTGMEAETIALTAWTRLDKFPVSALAEKRVKDFIEEHNKRFNPEGF